MKVKVLIYVGFFALIMSSCSKEPIESSVENVLMLRLSYDDLTLLDGQQYSFEIENRMMDSLPVYLELGVADLVSQVTIRHDETHELIFQNSAESIGTSAVSFPSEFIPADSFQRNLFDKSIDIDNSRFTIIGQDESSTLSFSYEGIWNAIKDLNLTHLYLNNDQSQIGVYPYTPFSFNGETDEWKYLIFLHKI